MWDKRVLRIIVALFVCVVADVSVASAETCPGNPDALGTSRVLTINPGEFTLLSTIQYKQTLPLKDHEVVPLGCPPSANSGHSSALDGAWTTFQTISAFCRNKYGAHSIQKWGFCV